MSVISELEQIQIELHLLAGELAGADDQARHLWLRRLADRLNQVVAALKSVPAQQGQPRPRAGTDWRLPDDQVEPYPWDAAAPGSEEQP